MLRKILIIGIAAACLVAGSAYAAENILPEALKMVSNKAVSEGEMQNIQLPAGKNILHENPTCCVQ